MKKLLFIVLINLFLIPHVNAISGEINGSSNGTNIYQTSDLKFYKYNGNAITTGFFRDNNSMSSYFQGNAGNSLENIVAFNTGELLQSGYIYSLTLYVGSSNNANQGDVSPRIGLGNWTDGALTSYLQGLNQGGCQGDVLSYKHSYNINVDLSVTNSGATDIQPQSTRSKLIYVVFRSNCAYSYVALPVNYASSPGNITFWGYHLSSLGSGQGLTLSDVQNIVNNATSDLSTSTDIRNAERNIKTQIEESTNKIDDTINNTDTSGSQGAANSFFEGFDTDDYGLSDIVTMPLDLIRGLTSNTCVSLNLTIPFVNKSFDLPCMSSIYQKYFGSFFNLYQIITFGFTSYWVIVRIFNLVKDFKNPDHDEIEVLDL